MKYGVNYNMKLLIDSVNHNPYCPYCDKQMEYDEVYPFESTLYKCDCDKWRKQEKLKLEIYHTQEKLLRLQNELKNMQSLSLRQAQIDNLNRNLNEIKRHFAMEDGYKWVGRD